MTRDIDVVIALSPQDTDTIVRIFTPGYYVSREAVTQSIARESLFNLIHEESIIKVDCIIRKNSSYRRAEFGLTCEFGLWSCPGRNVFAWGLKCSKPRAPHGAGVPSPRPD